MSLPEPSPDETPVRRPRRELVEAQIYEQATRLFAERGFAGTSLQDIADAMGMTRPSLYYYVKNKDQLLARLVTEITEAPAAATEEIADRDLDAVTKLRELVRLIAGQQARHAARFQLVIRSESELPDDLAGAHQAAKRRVLDGFVRVVDEGIRSGEFRPRPVRTTALALIGMCNWVAWWFRPGGVQSPEEVGEQMAEMAVAMVAQAPDRLPETPRPDDPAAALSLLRQDLDYLERIITTSPSKD
ncbi:TetR/AcrR family transcriptional regulator [Actinomycetospora sp. NBRC 106378]|uniref:TetR/AcrR family transcriptional regulator n=1 Tax=Actinomycetospora sp. NBRC 106378 TaxID=3032208 RepID=UPI00249F9F02|nr:TetR/AcrR family transcriptional regulator [Actinomycetospora sp. NBRC 106378]GLZ51375.1 TetR family transcriptional regulator [Actinomycetospora sp. NBRC 106378]